MPKQKLFNTELFHGRLRADQGNKPYFSSTKKTRAIEFGRYRPISCCNVHYEIVVVVIANRLKKFMSELISQNQNCIYMGKKIQDGIILAHEMVRGLSNGAPTRRACIKIDLKKAIDSVSRECILNTPLHIGFAGKFIDWIRIFIADQLFRCQWMHLQHDISIFQEWLDKGIPFPIIYFIAMEASFVLLETRVLEKEELWFVYSRIEAPLSHLVFADDILVFHKVENQSIKSMESTFTRFAKCKSLAFKRMGRKPSYILIIPALIKGIMWVGYKPRATSSEVLGLAISNW